MTSQITNSSCEVCGGYVHANKLCAACITQKNKIEEIRRQKKRDAAFGNIWEEAGVKDV